MSKDLVPLGSVVRVVYGSALREPDRVKSGRFDVFGSAGLVGHHDKALTTEPTIVIGRKGSVGAVTYAPTGGWVIDTAFYVEPIDRANIDLRYLFHTLKAANLARHTITTSIPGLSRDDIYRTHVRVPPLSEQRRIADILDNADAVRRKRRDAIDLTEELLRSAFLEMFGDPVTNPKGWPVKPLTDLAVDRQYGTAEKANAERLGMPVLRMNNLTYSGDMDLTDLKWVRLPPTEASKLDLRDGDVLFNRVNSHELVGKTAAWHHGEGYTFAGYLIRLRFPDGVATGDYIAGAMNMPSMKRTLFSMAKPSINMANISGSDLARIMMPIPPVADQRRYTALRVAVDSLRRSYRGSTRESDALFGSLVQRAFRGDSGLA